MIPSYIIIGVSRCGTTSLYNYISAHPNAKMAKGSGRREIHFFDYAHLYVKGIEWYKAQFPNAQVTGETSPTYLQHPFVPIRMAEYCSNTKFIVMLRNPIDRAYSDYWLAVRKGWIKEPFKEWIKKEYATIQDEISSDEFWSNDFYLSTTHLCGFLERGKYAQQLKRWFFYFPREQFLIIDSQLFFKYPQNQCARVLDFLGLDAYTLRHYRQWQRGDYPKMGRLTRTKLSKLYKEHNKQLYDLLGKDFEWT